jgi:probable rRNA maturation factor
MKDNIDIQICCKTVIPVSHETLIHWVSTTLSPEHEHDELTLRLVEPTEMRNLNRVYRKQDKTTNVLAFPSTLPDEIMQIHPFLGDVVICPVILEEESLLQNTPLTAHWAHIVIHGILHLLGHDHIEDKDTAIMQSLETKLLNTLGFDNPYKIKDDSFE